MDLTQGLGLEEVILPCVPPRRFGPSLAPTQAGSGGLVTSGAPGKARWCGWLPGSPAPPGCTSVGGLGWAASGTGHRPTAMPARAALRGKATEPGVLAGGGRHFWGGRSGKSELAQTLASPFTQAIYIYVYKNMKVYVNFFFFFFFLPMKDGAYPWWRVPDITQAGAVQTSRCGSVNAPQSGPVIISGLS